MTRVLSELLGAKEPGFRLGLRQLEQASGAPSEDIRLSSQLQQQVRESLRELGLDPHDTTGPELYAALQERLKHDDVAVRELLGPAEPGNNLMVRTDRLIHSLDVPKRCFALKAAVAKRLLKKNPPKKAMKRLGYRSLDSMLKHEPVALVYAAALIGESAQWHKALLAQYKQLTPTDFEVREVQVFAPDAKRWQTFGSAYVHEFKHNILAFKELGGVVLLPLAADAVPGAAIATLVLALQAINDIRATSSYLKLHQVRPDFGALLAAAVRDEPYTQASLAGQGRLPWSLIQHYFAHTPNAFSPELFEPHVQADDLKTALPEHTLAKLHPRFEFWKGRAHVGLLDDHGAPVSLNLADAVLNFCNHLPYEQRLVHHFRKSLWHELMRRYLHQDNLEQAVHDQLGDELVDEKALA